MTLGCIYLSVTQGRRVRATLWAVPLHNGSRPPELIPLALPRSRRNPNDLGRQVGLCPRLYNVSVSPAGDLNPVAVKLPDPAVDLVRNPLGWGRLERLFHRTSALRQTS